MAKPWCGPESARKIPSGAEVDAPLQTRKEAYERVWKDAEKNPQSRKEERGLGQERQRMDN